jgi:DinB superfamily
MVSSVMTNPYAVHLEGRDPRTVIASTPNALRRLAADIGPSRITTPRAPGKWSARDILCHLADCEVVFAFRLRQALAEDHHVIQPFDQDLWAKPYGQADAEAALATFTAVRAWNIALLKGVTTEQVRKPVTHPERGDMTFDTIVETMGGHDRNHIKQLEEIAAGAGVCA